MDVLNNTAIEIFEKKKKALEEGDESVTQQIGKGKDIMSILSASAFSLDIVIDVYGLII